MSAMPEQLKLDLAERRIRKRQELWESRLRRDREQFEKASDRDRVRVARMRVGYFQEHYGERWQEVMAARAEGRLVAGVDR